MNLQPNETTELNWDELKFRTRDYLSGQQLELCLWTSLPNHHLEINNDNDVSCTEVLVATNERFPVAFSHSFNPVADELYLDMQSSVQNEKIEAHIFNAKGQLVHSEAITAQRQSLELGHLPDGAYFLQIVAGQRIGWGKFAKY